MDIMVHLWIKQREVRDKWLSTFQSPGDAAGVRLLSQQLIIAAIQTK